MYTRITSAVQRRHAVHDGLDPASTAPRTLVRAHEARSASGEPPTGRDARSDRLAGPVPLGSSHPAPERSPALAHRCALTGALRAAAPMLALRMRGDRGGRWARQTRRELRGSGIVPRAQASSAAKWLPEEFAAASAAHGQPGRRSKLGAKAMPGRSPRARARTSPSQLEFSFARRVPSSGCLLEAQPRVPRLREFGGPDSETAAICHYMHILYTSSFVSS